MEESTPTSVKSPPKWPIFLLLAAALIVPAMFWRQSWFGGHLSDGEILRRLSQGENPRQLQHACEQISQRMQRDPQGARQFYDPLVSLADHPDEQIRCVVAWLMGEEGGGYQPFHQALLGLVNDQAPGVRYNAALALVRFDEQAARPVLCEMLVPYTVSAEWEGPSSEGVVIESLARKDPVRPRTQIALVDTGQEEPEPVLAPLAGRIGQLLVGVGRPVTKGQPLCVIEPEFQQIYQALRALTLIGEPEDEEYIQPYLDPDNSFSRAQRSRLQTQARLAIEAIQR